MSQQFSQRAGRILTVLDVHGPGGVVYYAIDIYEPDTFTMSAEIDPRWQPRMICDMPDTRELVLKLTADSFPGGFRYVMATTLEAALSKLADMAAEDPPTRHGIPAASPELTP